MDTWKLAVAWAAAMLITTAVTWQIVSFADSQVSARPVEVIPATSTTSTGATSSSSVTTTSSTSVTTTSTVPGTTGSTSGSSTSSPTTSPTSTSTPTTAEWSVRTITTDGGTVVIRHRPEEVELQAATPAPGFEVEIDDAGPDKVEVEFESDDSDVRVEAEWSNGELDVTVS